MTAELHAKLKAELHYDPETGVFTRASDGPVRKAGERVGSFNKALGYITVNWNGGNKYAHRLAWLYMHGCWPKFIDHINGDRADNRWSNLREAKTGAQNQQNRSGKALGANRLIGAYFEKRTGKYTSRINADGKTTHLGRFKTEQEAHQAYLAAKSCLHTFNPIPRAA